MQGTRINERLTPIQGAHGDIIRLSTITLGENYLVPKDLKNQRYQWYCLVDDDDNVRGFASYTMRGNVATIEDVAVDPKYQGLGWASRLIRDVVKMLQYTQVDTVRCPAWETDSGVHLDKALRRNEFEPRERVLRTPDNARTNFSCPACGTPCKCYMVIYEAHINNHYGEIKYSGKTAPV